MKKTKFMSLLMAICCVFACLGICVTFGHNYVLRTNAATTTYSISYLDPLSWSTASCIEAIPYNEGVNAKPDGNTWVWDYEFNFVAGSGEGFLWNGEEYSGWRIKQPNDFYIDLGKSAVAGDCLIIDGTFSNEQIGVGFDIDNCCLAYTGTKWVAVTATYNIGTLVLHGNSRGVAGPAKMNDRLYLAREDGEALPFQNWGNPFTDITGEGFKVNGEVKTINEMQSAPDGLYLSFGAVNKNDVVTIGGRFYCENQKILYIIGETEFLCIDDSGESQAWTKQYEIDELNVVWPSNSSTGDVIAVNNAMYLTTGKSLPVKDWDPKFVLREGGIKKNGVQIGFVSMQSPCEDGRDLYVVFEGVSAGDVISISGKFNSSSEGVEYVIKENKFKWDGSVWKDYDYKTQETSKLAVESGDNSSVQVYPAGGSFGTGDWDNKYVLEPGSGEGLKLNGTTLSTDDIKQPGSFYINLKTTAKQGDVLTIDGAYYNDTTLKMFIFDNCAIQFNGTKWEPYVEQKIYELGVLKLQIDAKKADCIYLVDSDGNNLGGANGWDNNTFKFKSGGMTLNGKPLVTNDVKDPGSLYIGFGKNAEVGGLFTIEGTIYNDENIYYVIERSVFQWNGSAWIEIYEDNRLATYDEKTISDLGVGAGLTVTGTKDNAGLSYVKSAENTTGSIKFRFNYKSENTNTGAVWIRLRGSEWEGYTFRVIYGAVNYNDTSIYTLNNDTDYLIEFAVINILDTNNVWVYISVNGVIVKDNIVENPNVNFNTNHVSLYFDNVAETTLMDPDYIKVKYNYSYAEDKTASAVDYAEKGSSYVLASAKSYKTFVAWENEGTLYGSKEEITVGTKDLVFDAVDIDFTLEDGASIRLNENAESSGIRFTAFLKDSDFNILDEYGDVSYGIIIVPFDYLGYDQEPNLNDFTTDPDDEEKQLLVQLPSNVYESVDGYRKYRGAIQKLYESNYERLFAGRGYIEITIGERKITAYTPFDLEENVRSIKQVAQAFVNSAEYESKSDKAQEVATAYADCEIILTNYSKYKANDYFSATAWYYPELDPSNSYNNDTNKAIAKKMVDAGIKVVYLDGAHHLDLNTHENIVKTLQIIEFFWSQGLHTIAFGSNAGGGDRPNINYSGETYSGDGWVSYPIDYPDFSSCEGFLGFLVWDEPKSSNFETLKAFAQNFEKTYAGTGVTFMANLLPSYATDFNEGSASRWESTIDKLQKDDYKAYLQAYCDTVLSQVSGEKWLSMDSYPINADQTLTPNFLFDLAMLKYYAEYASATSHAVLQSSGWTESGNTTKNRMPTQAELEMQAYTAMAFGIDSVSWWSYSNKRGDNQQNPTDSDDYYNRFKGVNTELTAVSAIYKAFDWKGVILGIGKDNKKWNALQVKYDYDNDYLAFNAVKGQIGAYELSASSTKNLASVDTNNADLNYLMSVMEDKYGNEGYVLVNYNNHASDRAQTITIEFKADVNVTEVIIYRNGKEVIIYNGKEEPEKKATLNNNTLTVELATGEGVMILPLVVREGAI